MKVYNLSRYINNEGNEFNLFIQRFETIIAISKDGSHEVYGIFDKILKNGIEVWQILETTPDYIEKDITRFLTCSKSEYDSLKKTMEYFGLNPEHFFQGTVQGTVNPR